KIIDKILSLGGVAIVTADHGNADKMEENDGSPFTAHTTNKVPFVVVGEQFKGKKLREGGILADVAPTLLDMMGLPVPAEMSVKTLIMDVNVKK
ncbi:MAG: 2,3-bisphosphoglycerate-independent phosphoglycerate mutase, partial [Clostridia bacterium]|nr:2,3-bisphosphoglycerate-independent phosphoglycerate mutase [Clostridia bacterium]